MPKRRSTPSKDAAISVAAACAARERPTGPATGTLAEETIATGDEFALVYDLLRAQARSAMDELAPNHTLQPTDLANAAFLKLIRRKPEWGDQGHFLALAAHAMRSILVDHARTRACHKRSPTGEKVELSSLLVSFDERAMDVLAVDEALDRLAKEDSRAARVVELQFFGGLKLPAIAQLMKIPLRTVELDWRFAKAWLHTELS